MFFDKRKKKKPGLFQVQKYNFFNFVVYDAMILNVSTSAAALTSLSRSLPL